MPVRPSYDALCGELDRRRRITLGFERIVALLRLLGNPHHSLRIVQVVGTNGKGTTAVALAGTLEAAGRPSGAYLSPHVLSYTERVMLRGRFVSEKEFASTMSEVMEIADANDVPATQFEVLTAGALAMFRDARLEWAVLEAGLGARHDATSAAEATAVVLTNVGLDHTEYLGDTVEEITEEKLASLRPGSVLILGTEDPQVIAIAREVSARVRASIVVEHKKTEEQPYYKTGNAPYLACNELLGMRAAEMLLGRSLRQAERATVHMEPLPARFEVHEVYGVAVVVDGAHNLEGLKAALRAVRERYGDRPLGVVFGALKGKDVGSMLSILREAYAFVLTCPADADGRALDPGWIKEVYAPQDARGRGAWVVNDAVVALRTVVGEMEKVGGVVLVTGSLYTCAGVLRWLRGR
ncbi:MAG: Mur ligase family protein [Actinomycetota bacterium]|nr:Mur ligase family protein [Actinomycetota bacterium]